MRLPNVPLFNLIPLGDTVSVRRRIICKSLRPHNWIVILCSNSPTMGELTEACVELARLEKQEQEVIEQLYNVRTAIRAQRTKLDELIRGIHAPIDRLPNELLLRIFELSIHASILAFPSCDVHRHREERIGRCITSLEGFDTALSEILDHNQTGFNMEQIVCEGTCD